MRYVMGTIAKSSSCLQSVRLTMGSTENTDATSVAAA